MPGDVGQGTSGLVLLLGAVIGPGNRLTCISLKQESPGPLTHLSCLHITHCLPELLDKSPIPSAGSSRSKETHRLPYPPSFFVLCSASYTCGVPCGWGGVCMQHPHPSHWGPLPKAHGSYSYFLLLALYHPSIPAPGLPCPQQSPCSQCADQISSLLTPTGKDSPCTPCLLVVSGTPTLPSP